MATERDEDNRRFRVGDLTDFKQDDPFVTGWDAAVEEAKRQQDAHPFDDVLIGIWNVDDNNDISLDGIFYLDSIFTP